MPHRIRESDLWAQLEDRYGDYARSLLIHIPDPEDRRSTAYAHLGMAFTLLQHLYFAAVGHDADDDPSRLPSHDPFDYDHVFRQLLLLIVNQERPSRLELLAGNSVAHGQHQAGQERSLAALEEHKLFVKNLRQSAAHYAGTVRQEYLNALIEFVDQQTLAGSFDDLIGDRNRGAGGRTEFICTELGKESKWEHEKFAEVQTKLTRTGVVR